MEMQIKLFIAVFLLFLPHSLCSNVKLLREYIGAENVSVKFSDLPINPDVEIHFILSFAIDYTKSAHSPSPTNGKFNVFWDKKNLRPKDVLAIKSKYKNVKVAVSLGGDVVGKVNTFVQFQPWSISSWVQNAVSTLSEIIKEYHLDGVDIDYEHFDFTDTDTFAECIGQLIVQLKQKNLISMASIAPYENSTVQPRYLALWNKYGRFIDHVNFQFYAYPRSTTVEKFLIYFDIQASNYNGGKILPSFGTDSSSGGLKPDNGFFEACEQLKEEQKLEGIFIWSADDSKKYGFQYEKQSQVLLASS
ncbi:chitinase 2-like [Cryptomeria japonica]|uniref:chitinase 2-like n=1 Tax=Cryptomeria japonica TaxID=3369 RepID=UPI0027DA449A|nr:chitinase 2-like [Cryptomeria japonica]